MAIIGSPGRPVPHDPCPRARKTQSRPARTLPATACAGQLYAATMMLCIGQKFVRHDAYHRLGLIDAGSFIPTILQEL